MISPPTIAILGSGRLGSILARALAAAGWPVAALWNRSPERAEALAAVVSGARVYADAAAALAAADAALVTVADDGVEPFAAELAVAAAGGLAGKIVFHTSGALAAAALAPLAAAGAKTGALHPLQTFADPAQALERLSGTCWAADGDEDAMQLARAIVATLGGRLIVVPAAGRVLYHAAAVMAANYLVALADTAGALMARAGVDREDALRALTPLMAGTLENLSAGDAAAALTGPVARGDAATIARHREAIAALDPETDSLYRALGRRCLELARARGLDPALAAQVSAALEAELSG